jgi:hypothetical protein
MCMISQSKYIDRKLMINKFIDLIAKVCPNELSGI